MNMGATQQVSDSWEIKPTIPLTKRLSELYTLRDQIEIEIIAEEAILREKWHALPTRGKRLYKRPNS